MTNGVDPTFESTVQVVTIVGDSDIIVATQDAIFTCGLPVPPGVSYLVESIAVRYRPGLLPTDPYVPLVFGVAFPAAVPTGPGPSQLREGINLYPPGGWGSALAFPSLNVFADRASPIRFWPGEQIVCQVPVYGDATHRARVTVALQTRIVNRVPGSGSQGDTFDVIPVPEAVKDGPNPEGWG